MLNAFQRKRRASLSDCERRGLYERKKRKLSNPATRYAAGLSTLESQVELYSLEPMQVLCIHCKAAHFREERTKSGKYPLNSFNSCCGHGLHIFLNHF